MKKLLFFMVVTFSIVGIVYAQNISTKIDSINVNFDGKFAQIQTTQGYYDNSGNFQSEGQTAIVSVNEPAFDQMINTLTQDNALNLNAVQQVILNNA